MYILEGLLGLVIIAFIISEVWGLAAVIGFVVVVVFILIAAASSLDASYETPVQTIRQKETDAAYFLCAYLDALDILNKVLKEQDIGEVTISLIRPSIKSSDWVEFYIESHIYDHEWLQEYLFTVDIEEDMRNCKKKGTESIYFSFPKWEIFYKTGTIWKNLTDNQVAQLSMWINNKAVVECKPAERNFTKLEGKLHYHCKENKIHVYLGAIADTIREKYPNYNVEVNFNAMTVIFKPNK